jgi:hypothetical protein
MQGEASDALASEMLCSVGGKQRKGRVRGMTRGSHPSVVAGHNE